MATSLQQALFFALVESLYISSYFNLSKMAMATKVHTNLYTVLK